jgi:hypothetical protein
VTVTTNWTVAQQGNYLDGQITLDVGGTDRYAHMHNYRPSAASSLGLAGTLDFSATGLPVVMGQGPGAPTGGIASALGDASVDELMSRMAGSSGSAADPLSGLLSAYGASGYSPALAASGASLDAAFAEVGRDHIHMYCFAAGTPVTLADGTQRPIETLRANDLILATPDTDPTAPPQPYRITTIYHNAPAALLNLHIGDDILRVTPNHPLYIHNRGWVPAGDVNIGDEMLTASGDLVPITDKFDNGDIEPVYNLHVAGARTYFVGAAGVLVHNTSPMLQALIDQSAEALVGGVYGFLHDAETYWGGDGSWTATAFAFTVQVFSFLESVGDLLSGDPPTMEDIGNFALSVLDVSIEFISDVGEWAWENPLEAALTVAAVGLILYAAPAGVAIYALGAAAGTANGILSAYAADPEASWLAVGSSAVIGGVFGAISPAFAFFSLGGGVAGGVYEVYEHDGDFLGAGYLIGSLVGGLGGGFAVGVHAAKATGCPAPYITKLYAGLRSITPELVGGTIAGGATYIHTGDAKAAAGAAALGMMGGSLARLSSGIRNFADPRRGVCFAPFTLVDTPDGQKPIADIQAGELVLSRTDDDPHGPIEAKVVEEVFVRTGILWRLSVAGREIFCTAEHPFYVQDQGWTPASQLHSGQRLSTDCGEWVSVESIECTDVESEVYNFRVADYHTYFVGGTGWGFSVWAHNTCPPIPDDPTPGQVEQAKNILGSKYSATARPDLVEWASGVLGNAQKNAKVKTHPALGDPQRPLTNADLEVPRLPRRYGEDAGDVAPSNWGKYIEEQTGVAAPEGMTRSHGHHINMKKGQGSQVPFVESGKDLLEFYDINWFKGTGPTGNLVHAPNVEGQHTTEAARKLYGELLEVHQRNVAAGVTWQQGRSAILEQLQDAGERMSRLEF